PVIGFIRVGSQGMADRYTYVPLIGLFLVVVWWVGDLAGRWRSGRPATAGMAAVALAVLSVLTATQIRYWQNSYDLYAHALAVVERNWIADKHKAKLPSSKYWYHEAIMHFRESLRINPEQP